MVSHGELPRASQETVPNLGNLPIDQQRDCLFDIYTSQNLIDPTGDSYVTNNPLADIIRMKYMALTPYVDSVKERMRQGDVIRIVVDTEISPVDLFAKLRAVDNQDRDLILTRKISRTRLEMANRTGSDRDMNSITGYFGGEYANLAMKEYAVSAADDVTYASHTRPSSANLHVSPHSALLVYAAEALQEIAPKSRHILGSYGLHMFIDPRLKWQSLLATVESSHGSPNVSSEIGKSALLGLSSHFTHVTQSGNLFY